MTITEQVRDAVIAAGRSGVPSRRIVRTTMLTAAQVRSALRALDRMGVVVAVRVSEQSKSYRWYVRELAPAPDESDDEIADAFSRGPSTDELRARAEATVRSAMRTARRWVFDGGSDL